MMRPLEAKCLTSSDGEKTAWYRQNRRNLNSFSWQGDSEAVAPRLKRHFFSPLEMSPGAQSRDDTRPPARAAFQFG
jgi:hypothetical protein